MCLHVVNCATNFHDVLARIFLALGTVLCVWRLSVECVAPLVAFVCIRMF